MKKLLLFAAVAVFGFSSVNAQEFKAGVGVGLPSGDVSDAYTLNINLDLSYLWEVSDEFQAGVTTGYSHFMGDEESITILGTTVTVEFEDAGFIPLAAAGRFNVSEEFTLGADLGYAVGLSPDGNDGGFYYAPKVQYGVSEAIDIVASYRGVSVDGGSFSSINLGVEFGL